MSWVATPIFANTQVEEKITAMLVLVCSILDLWRHTLAEFKVENVRFLLIKKSKSALGFNIQLLLIGLFLFLFEEDSVGGIDYSAEYLNRSKFLTVNHRFKENELKKKRMKGAWSQWPIESRSKKQTHTVVVKRF